MNDTQKQKGLARAIEVCGKVAKLYRKWGKPPVFVAIKAEVNPPRQRARLAKQAVQPLQYICNTCQLPFLGATRCQCKSAVRARELVEVEA